MVDDLSTLGGGLLKRIEGMSGLPPGENPPGHNENPWQTHPAPTKKPLGEATWKTLEKTYYILKENKLRFGFFWVQWSFSGFMIPSIMCLSSIF